MGDINMFMTIEGVPGTGVDEDEAAAILIVNWYWGMHDDGCDNDVVYALTIVRESDQASPSLRRLFEGGRKAADATVYEYAIDGMKKIRTPLLMLTNVQVGYHKMVGVDTAKSLEILGLRFGEATVKTHREAGRKMPGNRAPALPAAKVQSPARSPTGPGEPTAAACPSEGLRASALLSDHHDP